MGSISKAVNKVLGSSPIELANRASVQKLSSESLSGLTSRLDNHESSINTNAHQISNIFGLSDALDSKQGIISGFTGSVQVVVSVDFAAQSVLTKTFELENGIILSIN